MAQKLVLVTGASGAVGPQIVTALLQAGYAARTLSRNPPAPGAQLGEVDTIVGDVTDPGMARKASRGVDTVLHLAALLHGRTGNAFERAAYQRVNVTGTATMMGAAVEAGARRFVLFSTVAVYGPNPGGVIDEGSPVTPDTPYAETKLAAERLVMDARDTAGRQFGVVLRLAAVYGAGLKGNYLRLVNALSRRRFVPLGAGGNRRTLVYDRDVASAALLAIEHPAAVGGIFNVTDGQFHTVAQITSAICGALGRQPPRLSVPVAPLRLCAGLADAVFRVAGRPPAGRRQMIDKYLEDVAVSGQKIQRDLGFSPQYDLQVGWREAVAEMQKRGAI